MNIVGQKERATQDRLVQLFQSGLGYAYLGNRGERGGMHLSQLVDASTTL